MSAHLMANTLARAHAEAQDQRFSDTTRTFPRSLSEAWPERRGMDWWVSAEAAAAEEEHIRAMFADPVKPQTDRSFVWAVRCIYLIAAGVAVAFFAGAFK